MIADPLIKGLPPKVFHEHTAHMGVVSIQDMSFWWEFVFYMFLFVDTFVIDIMDFKVICCSKVFSFHSL